MYKVPARIIHQERPPVTLKVPGTKISFDVRPILEYFRGMVVKEQPLSLDERFGTFRFAHEEKVSETVLTSVEAVILDGKCDSTTLNGLVDPRLTKMVMNVHKYDNIVKPPKATRKELEQPTKNVCCSDCGQEKEGTKGLVGWICSSCSHDRKVKQRENFRPARIHGNVHPCTKCKEVTDKLINDRTAGWICELCFLEEDEEPEDWLPS